MATNPPKRSKPQSTTTTKTVTRRRHATKKYQQTPAIDVPDTLLCFCMRFQSIPMASIAFFSLVQPSRPSLEPMSFALRSSGSLRSSYFPGGVNPSRKGVRVGVSVPMASAILVFRDLDADDFRHPLDKQVWSCFPRSLPWSCRTVFAWTCSTREFA